MKMYDYGPFSSHSHFTFISHSPLTPPPTTYPIFAIILFLLSLKLPIPHPSHDPLPPFTLPHYHIPLSSPFASLISLQHPSHPLPPLTLVSSYIGPEDYCPRTLITSCPPPDPIITAASIPHFQYYHPQDSHH